MSQTTILLTGASGMLGSHLLPALQGIGRCIPLGHRTEPPGGFRLDLRDREATQSLLERVDPDLIVHAAALADIDHCERDPVEAYRLNVAATRHLVDWVGARKPDCAFLYISTDQVYDSPGETAEDDISPLNVYAFTKLWAEDLARRLEQHLILRTNFFGYGGPHRATFVDWIIESSRERRPITLFQDVFFNPLLIEHLVEVIVELIGKKASGTFNLGAAGGGLSKGAFIRLLAEALGLASDSFRDGRLADVRLEARRPLDMRMSPARLEALIGRSLPSVEDGIAALARSMAVTEGRIGAAIK